jgi:regulator of sigma E protease
MLIGQLSWRNLSGPVTIADYAGKSATIGWFAYLNFLALISVSLAVLNLMPIPVLDGGHLVYYGLEAIRGQPMPKVFILTTQKVGLALIGLMMFLAFFNDISRYFT